MAKVRYQKVPPEQRDKMLQSLARILVSTTNEKDSRKLLEHLFTPSEIVMITRRVQIASLLMQGKSQWDIREQLGAGFSTIRSVERWLDDTFENYNTIRKVIRGRRRRKENMLYGTSVADWRAMPLNIAISKTDPYFAIMQLLVKGVGYFTEKKKPELESRLYHK